MKNSIYILCFFFAVSSLYSQDNTWFTDITEDLGLKGAEGSRVFCVDVNGDDYPDLLYMGKTSIRNTLELYLNTEDIENPGKRTYKRFTEESGINAPVYEGRDVRWSDVAGFADFDNDGDIDLMTCTYTHRISSFIDSAGVEGIEQGHYSEVLLNDGTGRFEILENSGMHDINVYEGKVKAKKAGELKSFDYPSYFLNATGISFLDYNLDGNIDAYISTWFVNYSDYEQIKMKDVLLRGNGDGTFTQITDKAIDNIRQPMYGVNATDYNNDGPQDIVTSAYCRSGGSIFENNGDGTFKDVTDITGYSSQVIGGDHGQPLCQWEALPGDYDGDGDMDLLQILVHGGYDPGEGHSLISINKGPYENYAYEWDLDILKKEVYAPNTHGGDMGGTWYDFNGDMKLDALICQSGYERSEYGINVDGQTRTYFFMQDDKGEFDEVTEELGLLEAANRPHSCEPCDFNLDGGSDLFLSRTFDIGDGRKPYLTAWENNKLSETFWTSVKITAPENCNRSAIGTRITVFADGVRQIREIQSGLGHFGNTGPFIKNFALSDVPAIDSMKIRFPDADLTETVLYALPVNVILNIGKDGLLDIVLPGAATKPVAGFSESMVDFDIVSLGTKVDSGFTIKNYGNETMTVSGAEITGDYPDVFSLGEVDFPFFLEPGESKTIPISFEPNEKKNFTGRVAFVSNAVNSEAGIMRLRGECFKTAPVIASKNERLEFGTVLNKDEVERTFELENRGESDLIIEDISTPPEFIDFFSFPDFAGDTIKQGEAKTFTVRFSPQSEKDVAIYTNLEIFSNAINESPLEIPMAGRAETRKAYIAFESDDRGIDFGEAELGCSCEEVFPVSAEGTKALEISDIDFIFDNTGIFGVKDYNPPYSIEPGNTHEFILTFTPKKEGTFARQMAIKSNDFNESKISFSIKGEGIDPTAIETELSENETLSLYPHPVAGSGTLEYTLENTLPGKMSIKVYDYLGRLRKEIDTPETRAGTHRVPVDFSDLPAGAYILKINTGLSQTEKSFIISK